MDSNSNQVIAPILMQRQCDGGKSDMTDEQWAEKVALRLQGQPAGFFGCGVWFQWYWGSGCVCPSCGRTFAVTIGDQERFRVLATLNTMKEREMEERVLRNVLTQIGRYKS
jgi:hypothetical protein